MLYSYLIALLLFGGIALGLAWPLASRLTLDPPEKVTACVALSVVGVFLFSWIIYVFALPHVLFWTLPMLAAASLVINRRPLEAALRAPDTIALVRAQVIISLWSVGWLALVLSYSGGPWLADWFGHMQRTWFFLEHGPTAILFNGFDPLTSRPPLANIVNGALLELTRRDFAHYQLFSTLLGSLVFLPAGLLARRWGGGRAIAVLTVLFMVNPMYLENVTYAWTKLPAAFFTLAALYFFIRAYDEAAPPVHAVLFGSFLAAGLITHYATGPYAVVLGLGWLALGWRRRRESGWWSITLFSVLSATLVLATWFGWAFATFGFHGSLMTNTSITDQAPSAAAQVQVVLANVRDTLVPHFLRAVDFSHFEQKNPLGWWRDWFFTLYQTNLFFAFGSVTWVGILIAFVKNWPPQWRLRQVFWLGFITMVPLLGIAVHGGQSAWGLAHICLQPFVLLGLAYLAAHGNDIRRPWRLLLIAGGTTDFVLGILLQFGTQAFALDRWYFPQRSLLETVQNYSQETQMGYYAQHRNDWVFFGDTLKSYGAITVALLVGLFLIAAILSGRQPSKSHLPGDRP